MSTKLGAIQLLAPTKMVVTSSSSSRVLARRRKLQTSRQASRSGGVSIATAALGEGPAGIKGGLSVREEAEIWSVVMVPPCGRPVTEDKDTSA